MFNSYLEAIPLWFLFFLIVVAVLCAILVGFYLGRRAGDSTDAINSRPPITSVVGAMLALLGFMLALTFNASSSRFEVRKKLLIDDVNAIRATYMRAGFLQSEERTAARNLLREYLDLRLRIIDESDIAPQLLQETGVIQSSLWAIAEGAVNSSSSAALTGRFADALIRMEDIHTQRVMYGIHFRIHPSIWMALFGVGTLSLGALGFQFGISGGRRYQISLLFAICFGSILILIMDLERPDEGTVKVDYLPLELLKKEISEG